MRPPRPIQTRADDLSVAVDEIQDEQLRERVDAYIDSLTANAESGGNQLEGTQFGTFEVVFAALNYNYSWKIYEARRLRAEHADLLSDDRSSAEFRPEGESHGQAPSANERVSAS